MGTVKNYLSLIRFSHTIFAMPFALVGFFLGVFYSNLTISVLPGSANEVDAGALRPFHFSFDNKWDYLTKLILVVLCMIFARSAAMAFNRYLDRNFDAKNPRTAIREIPSGIISANSTLVFTVTSAFFFIVACFFINRLCFFLSPVALAVVLGYSYTKRFTPFCHIILGLGLSLAPIGAFLAVTGHFSLIPILFSLTVIFWVSGFDIIYALQDEEFDKSQNLYSMPAWLGKARALHVSEALHGLSGSFTILAGVLGHFGWLYWIGVVVFCGMLIYQHSIVKPNDVRRVNIAFMTANGIASIVFAFFAIADLFTH